MEAGGVLSGTAVTRPQGPARRLVTRWGLANTQEAVPLRSLILPTMHAEPLKPALSEWAVTKTVPRPRWRISKYLQASKYRSTGHLTLMQQEQAPGTLLVLHGQGTTWEGRHSAVLPIFTGSGDALRHCCRMAFRLLPAFWLFMTCGG